jgi:hypothetical protein
MKRLLLLAIALTLGLMPAVLSREWLELKVA